MGEVHECTSRMCWGKCVLVPMSDDVDSYQDKDDEKTIGDESCVNQHRGEKVEKSPDQYLDPERIFYYYPSPPRHSPAPPPSPRLSDPPIKEPRSEGLGSRGFGSKGFGWSTSLGRTNDGYGNEKNNICADQKQGSITRNILLWPVRAVKKSTCLIFKILKFIVSSRLFLVLCILLLVIALVYTTITSRSAQHSTPQVIIKPVESPKGTTSVNGIGGHDSTKGIIDNSVQDSSADKQKSQGNGGGSTEGIMDNSVQDSSAEKQGGYDSGDANIKQDEIKPEKIPSAVQAKLDGDKCVQKMRESISLADFYVEYCSVACDVNPDESLPVNTNAVNTSTVCLLGEFMNHGALSTYKGDTAVCDIEPVACDNGGLVKGLEFTNKTFHRVGNLFNYVTCRGIIEYM